jgi:oligoribonuclease (3'-5' exoribonuclease)
MTGLNPDTEEIIEIACFVTDYDLNLLDEEGLEIVVGQSKERMDQMDEWCIKTHKASGLTDAVIKSDVTAEQAADLLLAYIKKYVPEPRKALLAGNSIHADRSFLRIAPYNKVTKHLHHRLMDVSTIKEAAKRWSPKSILDKSPQKKGVHEARQDILESIAEARYYRDQLFKR